MKNVLKFLWVCFLVTTVGGLGATEYPLILKDDSGTLVTLKNKPIKILSFTMMSDEILFDLLDSKRFAAVNALSVDPQVSNVAEKAAKVVRRMEFTVEGVLSLNPDLVVVADWSDGAKVQQIRSLGIPIFLLATPVTVEKIKSQILKLSLLVDEQEGGLKLIQTMEEKIIALTTAQKNLTSPLRVMDYNTWGASSGKGTSWDEMLKLAGLTNGVGELKADLFGQVPISKEILILQNPDIIFLPSWTYNQELTSDTFLNQILEDPSLQGVEAVKNGRVYVFPERLKSTISHYLAEGAWELFRLSYSHKLN